MAPLLYLSLLALSISDVVSLSNLALKLRDESAIATELGQSMHVVHIDINAPGYETVDDLKEAFKFFLFIEPSDGSGLLSFELESNNRRNITLVTKEDTRETKGGTKGGNKGEYTLVVKFNKVENRSFGNYKACVCDRRSTNASEALVCGHDCHKLTFTVENKLDECSEAPANFCGKIALGYNSVKTLLSTDFTSIKKVADSFVKNSETVYNLVSDSCHVLLEPTVCVMFLPKCVRNRESRKLEYTGLCKKDCVNMFDVCNGWETLRNATNAAKHVYANLSVAFENLGFGDIVGPEVCNKLIDTNCISLNSTQMRNTIEKVNTTKNCYNETDRGESYRGTLTHANALNCKSWDMMGEYKGLKTYAVETTLYSELYDSRNFCRNPINLTSGERKEKPWCFVGRNEWSYCHVPKCGLNDEDNSIYVLMHKLSSPPVVLILSGVIALIITFFFAVFLMLLKCRRKQELPEEQFFKNVKNAEYNYASQDETGMWNYERNQIQLISKIGQGEFGIVHKAEIRLSNDQVMQVAVKALRVEASSSEQQQFRKEAELMNKFSHENIVKFCGVCFEGAPHEPLYMIFEFMPNGDLHEYLRKLCPSVLNSMDERESSNAISLAVEKNLAQFHSISIQIAKGLAYLAQKQFVHRDIAARNVLLSENTKDNVLTVKLSDFGLSRSVYTRNYYRMKSKSLLPVRWMPPEAITYATFTAASDVYSFGIVLWEIFTFGTQPYESIPNEDVVSHILKPEVLKQPIGCPNTMYEIMMQCWNYHSKNRPSAEELIEKLQHEASRSHMRSPPTLHRAHLPQHNYNNMEAIVKSSRQNAAAKSQISPGNGSIDLNKPDKASRFGAGMTNQSVKNPGRIMRPQFQIRPRQNSTNIPNKNMMRGNFRFSNANAAWRSPTGTFPPQVQNPNGPHGFNMSDLSSRGLPAQKTMSFDTGPRPPNIPLHGYPSAANPTQQQATGTRGGHPMQFPIVAGGAQFGGPPGMMHKFPPNHGMQSRKNSGLPSHMNNNRSVDQLNTFSAC